MSATDVPTALLSRQVLAESGSNILKDDDPSQHHCMKSIIILLVGFFITPVPFHVFLGRLAKVDFLQRWQYNEHDTPIRTTLSGAIFLFNMGPTYIGFLINRNDRCAEHDLRNL